MSQQRDQTKDDAAVDEQQQQQDVLQQDENQQQEDHDHIPLDNDDKEQQQQEKEDVLSDNMEEDDDDDMLVEDEENEEQNADFLQSLMCDVDKKIKQKKSTHLVSPRTTAIGAGTVAAGGTKLFLDDDGDGGESHLPSDEQNINSSGEDGGGRGSGGARQLHSPRGQKNNNDVDGGDDDAAGDEQQLERVAEEEIDSIYAGGLGGSENGGDDDNDDEDDEDDLLIGHMDPGASAGGGSGPSYFQQSEDATGSLLVAAAADDDDDDDDDVDPEGAAEVDGLESSINFAEEAGKNLQEDADDRGGAEGKNDEDEDEEEEEEEEFTIGHGSGEGIATPSFSSAIADDAHSLRRQQQDQQAGEEHSEQGGVKEDRTATPAGLKRPAFCAPADLLLAQANHQHQHQHHQQVSAPLTQTNESVSDTTSEKSSHNQQHHQQQQDHQPKLPAADDDDNKSLATDAAGAEEEQQDEAPEEFMHRVALFPGNTARRHFAIDLLETVIVMSKEELRKHHRCAGEQEGDDDVSAGADSNNTTATDEEIAQLLVSMLQQDRPRIEHRPLGERGGQRKCRFPDPVPETVIEKGLLEAPALPPASPTLTAAAAVSTSGAGADASTATGAAAAGGGGSKKRKKGPSRAWYRITNLGIKYVQVYRSFYPTATAETFLHQQQQQQQQQQPSTAEAKPPLPPASAAEEQQKQKQEAEEEQQQQQQQQEQITPLLPSLTPKPVIAVDQLCPPSGGDGAESTSTSTSAAGGVTSSSASSAVAAAVPPAAVVFHFVLVQQPFHEPMRVLSDRVWQRGCLVEIGRVGAPPATDRDCVEVIGYGKCDRTHTITDWLTETAKSSAAQLDEDVVCANAKPPATPEQRADLRNQVLRAPLVMNWKVLGAASKQMVRESRALRPVMVKNMTLSLGTTFSHDGGGQTVAAATSSSSSASPSSLSTLISSVSLKGVFVYGDMRTLCVFLEPRRQQEEEEEEEEEEGKLVTSSSSSSSSPSSFRRAAAHPDGFAPLAPLVHEIFQKEASTKLLTSPNAAVQPARESLPTQFVQFVLVRPPSPSAAATAAAPAASPAGTGAGSNAVASCRFDPEGRFVSTEGSGVLKTVTYSSASFSSLLSRGGGKAAAAERVVPTLKVEATKAVTAADMPPLAPGAGAGKQKGKTVSPVPDVVAPAAASKDRVSASGSTETKFQSQKQRQPPPPPPPPLPANQPTQRQQKQQQQNNKNLSELDRALQRLPNLHAADTATRDAIRSSVGLDARKWSSGSFQLTTAPAGTLRDFVIVQFNKHDVVRYSVSFAVQLGDQVVCARHNGKGEYTGLDMGPVIAMGSCSLQDRKATEIFTRIHKHEAYDGRRQIENGGQIMQMWQYDTKSLNKHASAPEVRYRSGGNGREIAGIHATEEPRFALRKATAAEISSKKDKSQSGLGERILATFQELVGRSEQLVQQFGNRPGGPMRKTKSDPAKDAQHLRSVQGMHCHLLCPTPAMTIFYSAAQNVAETMRCLRQYIRPYLNKQFGLGVNFVNLDAERTQLSMLEFAANSKAVVIVPLGRGTGGAAGGGKPPRTRDGAPFSAPPVASAAAVAQNLSSSTVAGAPRGAVRPAAGPVVSSSSSAAAAAAAAGAPPAAYQQNQNQQPQHMPQQMMVPQRQPQQQQQQQQLMMHHQAVRRQRSDTDGTDPSAAATAAAAASAMALRPPVSVPPDVCGVQPLPGLRRLVPPSNWNPLTLRPPMRILRDSTGRQLAAPWQDAGRATPLMRMPPLIFLSEEAHRKQMAKKEAAQMAARNQQQQTQPQIQQPGRVVQQQQQNHHHHHHHHHHHQHQQHRQQGGNMPFNNAMHPHHHHHHHHHGGRGGRGGGPTR